MKRTICIIIFLIMMCTKVYATNIVALGDSITYGYAVEDNEKYVNIVSKELNTNCTNLAINGLTTEGLLLELEKERSIR